ncbi:HugZ family protein [Pseudomonadota bacterium]
MNQNKKMKPLDEGRLKSLICQQRWAALGTLVQGRSSVSWVAYAIARDGSLLLHLSRLAQHTRSMLADASISLSVSETDDGQCDPQTLARVTLEGDIEVLERDDGAYSQAKKDYLERLPNAEMLFGFEDFSLFRFTPTSAHYVEGFGSTHRLPSEKLLSIICSK